jgi:hypothetical protein
MRLIEVIVLSVGIMLCGFVIFLTELARKEGVQEVPCSMLLGGWHPDIPKKYAEQCALAQKERSDR